VEEWAAALERTAWSQALRGSSFLYPCVEIAHIVGFVVLVGSIAMFDVRLLGASRHLPVSALGAHLRKWSLASVALVVPSGLLLAGAHPVALAGNPVFGVKLGAIALAGLNALAFRRGVQRSVATWDTEARAPLSARLHAVASLALWVTAIACGRLLAYT
jgi:hypothetical protein